MDGDKFQRALEDDDNVQPVAITAADVYGGGAMLPRRDVIKREPNGTLTYKRAVLTPVGLVLPDDATDAELIEIGLVLRGMESSIQWLIGDWLNRAERVWGQVYDDVPGYSYGTLRTYASVARSVQLSIRIDKLSFAHHQLVTALNENDQREWLRYALEQGLSVAQMRKAMKGEQPAEAEQGSSVQRQAVKWSAEVVDDYGRLATLNERQRVQLKQRAAWLARYYAEIAEKV